jgi:hypothetical protein
MRWEEIDPRAEGRPAHLVGELGGPLRVPALPAGYRARYRREFLAELYGMSPAEQLHHASGVLSRAWTLRSALTEPDRGSMGPPTIGA